MADQFKGSAPVSRNRPIFKAAIRVPMTADLFTAFIFTCAGSRGYDYTADGAGADGVVWIRAYQ
jgi:hypothetical protein